MKCPNCQSEVDEHETYCPECGEVLDNEFEDENEVDDEVDEDIFKEDNPFQTIMAYLLKGLDFVWRSILRPDHTMIHERVLARVSVVTVLLLTFLVSFLLYYYADDVASDNRFDFMYLMQLFVTIVLMFAVIYGVIFILSKTVLLEPLKNRIILKDYSVLMMQSIVIALFMILCLYNHWIEAMLILAFILVGMIVVHPVFLMQKYVMEYGSRIGPYVSSLIVFVVTVAVLLGGFYMTLFEIVQVLISTL